MEFLGVGPLEIFFILIIALIVLGPKDMIKAGKTIGSFLRKVVKSPTYQAVQQTSRDLRYLPNKLMREAGLEEDVQELQKIGRDVGGINSDVRSSLAADLNKATRDINQDLSAWTTPPATIPPKLEEQTILPSPPPPAPNPDGDETAHEAQMEAAEPETQDSLPLTNSEPDPSETIHENE